MYLSIHKDICCFDICARTNESSQHFSLDAKISSPMPNQRACIANGNGMGKALKAQCPPRSFIEEEIQKVNELCLTY